MEKNKFDTIQKMNNQMIKVLEIENTQLQNIINEGKDFNEREIYKKRREYWNKDSPELDKVVCDSFDGPYGEVFFKLFYPNNIVEGQLSKCIIFIHGGGFTVGDIDTHEGIIRRLAKETDAIIAAIDYHLVPEYIFPVQLEECEEFALFIHENSIEYKIDKEHISFAGDSAGAHLSLGVALRMRNQEKQLKIKSLLLFYGSYGLKDSMSRRLYGGEWDGLSLEELRSYEENYAGPMEDDNPYLSLINSDLTYGLPPTYILACELDPLLDDSKLLYTIMKEHGGIAKLDIFNGVIHGFLHYSKDLDMAKTAIRNSAIFYNEYR